MSNDEPSDKPSSTLRSVDSSSDSEAMEMLRSRMEALERQMVLVDRLAENVERIWDRSAWRIKLESTRADHVLALAGAVEKDSASRDRLTEAVLSLVRAYTELDEKVGYVKAAVDVLVQAQNTKQVVQDALKAAADKAAADQATADKNAGNVTKTIETAVEGAVDRITKSNRLLTQQDLEEGGKVEKGGGIFYFIVLIYRTFTKADIITRVLTFFLALFALAGFLGWLIYRVHMHAEAPQGVPLEQSRIWKEKHALPATPQVSFPPAPAK